MLRKLLGISCLLISNLSFAAAGFAPGGLLPGSVLPERQSSELATQPVENPRTLAPLPKPQQQAAPNALGEQAAKIKFKLTQVKLVGNHVYSEQQLQSIYQDKVNKTISVAELQDIVQNITNYYRNNGYILTRAILPPQHVSNGVVYIQVIEGYIDVVNVIGVPKGARRIVQSFGNKISADRPLQVKTMEHYLLLANQVPGVQVKAVLEPSKTNVGASTLNLVTETKTFGGYISYDNYGTRYIGPQQATVGVEGDSLFLSGDSTQLNATRTMRPQELKFFQALYNIPVGVEGARWIFSGNQSLTRPQYVLVPLKINGDAVTLYTMLQYPLMRTRSQNLTWDTSFNYIDSAVTAEPFGIAEINLYHDHLRTLRTGLSYDMSDRWYGANSAAAHIEFGLPILGATPESESTSGQTSRFGGSGHFAKMDFTLSRLQQFGASRYSAFLSFKGQWSLEPLLATEQVSYGGAQSGMGRGYDPAEIIGDRGFGGSLEFRANVSPGRRFLQAMQLYAFYDAGVIWNAKDVIEQPTKQSITSTGLGSRFFFNKYFTGNLLWAQPLTKQVAALQLIGDGRQPRVFFSITGSV